MNGQWDLYQQVKGIDGCTVQDPSTLADGTYQPPKTVMIAQPPIGQSSLQKKVKVPRQHYNDILISTI